MKQIGIFFATILAIILLVGTYSTPTSAQAYRGLIIDEFKFEINDAKPGDVYTRTFNVTHDFIERNKEITLYMKSMDFTSDGVTGTPRFLPYDSLAPEASLANWITFDKSSVFLDSYGQKEQITFTITVPENAEPGGKYAAVLLSDTEGKTAIDENDESQRLGLNKELGPLVLLTVEGEVRKDVKANSLYTTNIEGKSRKFYFNPPINLHTEIFNDGNIHTTPRGVFYIFKGRNFQKNIAKFDMNEKQGYVLPGTTRTYTATWNESFITYTKEINDEGETIIKTNYNWDQLSKLRIGKYNVKLLYNTEAQDGTVQTMEMITSFWIIPWQLIVLVVATILYLYYKYRRGKRNENEKKPRKKAVVAQSDK
jgi:hypothetical protein